MSDPKNVRNRISRLKRIFPFSILLLITVASACSGSQTIDLDQPTAAPIVTTTPPVAGTSNFQTAVEDENALTGKILFLTFVEAKAALVSYDLEKSQQSVIFEFPQNGWLNHFAASPDYTQLVLAYLPPANWDGPPVAESSLFIMPVDGSGEPELLLAAETPDIAFRTPAWSADGAHIYYTRVTKTDPTDPASVRYDLERIHLESGTIDPVIGDAVWPSLSPDGQMMAYLTVEAESSDNHLYTADPLGADQRLAVDPEEFMAVDAQIFSPDSALLYFSGAVEQPVGSGSIWDFIAGVEVAQAHSFPADWWRVELEGGGLEKLTDFSEVGLAGVFSPDGQHIASVGSQGVYVMKPDGTDLVQILRTVTFGSVAWIP